MDTKQKLEVGKKVAMAASIIASGAMMIIDSKLTDLKLVELVNKAPK